MKILAISDLHGRSVWQEANLDAYDQVVFLGDYTDSYVFDDDTIYSNLNTVIQRKMEAPDKFVLLIGNHDAQYLHYPLYRCSGFRQWSQLELSSLLIKHKDLFQIAHQQKNFLFTHAGVTNKWLAHFLAKTHNDTFTGMAEYDLAGLLNEAHGQSAKYRNLLFEIGPKRGGYDAFGGPVWADRSETRVDYLTGFHQVVGHTPVADFNKSGNEVSSITYTDVLQTKMAFYEVIIPD
ncbi:metallophosphoesterase family protein [Spirosoma aerophilum]